MTLSAEIPRAPIPMDAERRERLRLMAEREGQDRLRGPRPGYGRQTAKMGTKADKIVHMLKVSGLWITTVDLAKNCGCNQAYVARFLGEEAEAGRVRRRFGDPSPGGQPYEWQWKV